MSCQLVIEMLLELMVFGSIDHGFNLQRFEIGNFRVKNILHQASFCA